MSGDLEFLPSMFHDARVHRYTAHRMKPALTRWQEILITFLARLFDQEPRGGSQSRSHHEDAEE